MIIIEPTHMSAILHACRTSILICEALPETETVMELKSILSMEGEILDCALQGHHFGTKALQQFRTYCQQTSNELENITKD